MTDSAKTIKPPFQPAFMNLYPAMNSVEEVIALALSKIPVTHQNEMVSILMTYHNTLMKEIHNDKY